MDDYREIGPPGNGKTRKTRASSLAAVRETARHVELHANHVIFRGALIWLRVGKQVAGDANPRFEDGYRAVPGPLCRYVGGGNWVPLLGATEIAKML